MHPGPSTNPKQDRLGSNFISVLQATVAFPSTMGSQSSSHPSRGGETQAWKGTLEEGRGGCKCVLKADGVWERKSVWQQGGNQITGEAGKAAKKKQLKEVVIKCEAGDFQGSFQLWQKSGPGQF